MCIVHIARRSWFADYGARSAYSSVSVCCREGTMKSTDYVQFLLMMIPTWLLLGAVALILAIP